MPLPYPLLPHPRQVTTTGATLNLAADRLILLEADNPRLLMPAAGRVKTALQAHGIEWQVYAGRGVPAGMIGVTLRLSPEQVPQSEGYQLHITPGGISLLAHDPAGAFYGACTLAQIIQMAGGVLPCAEIHDHPDFAVRGVMLDISRDKVYRMETLTMLVDMLAGWKVNQLQLYMEHTFAYHNHPDVWAQASPMTGEEIMALDAYCRERFIELVPNQNSFGHMHRWLTHPRYAVLGEVVDGFEAPWGWTEGPFSLAPGDPHSLELVESLFDELLPHFSSRMVNVGADETFDIGQGKSKSLVDTCGEGRVYLDYLLALHRAAAQRGFRMQFWGDIITRHPELVPELPGDAIALEWGYEANHPFNEHGALFAKAGIEFYVCPGTSAWNSIAGRTDNALGDLLNAAENGLRHGARGYLITDWGDAGHWQTLPVSWLGFAAGSAYAWCLDANRSLDIPAALDRYAFMDASGVMGKLASELGNLYQATGISVANGSALFHALQFPLERLARTRGLWLDKMQAIEAALDSARACLDDAQMARADSDLVTDEYRLTIVMLRHACCRARFAGESDSQCAAEQKAWLRNDLESLLLEYRRIWLARNRPGGLSDSVGRLERLRADYVE